MWICCFPGCEFFKDYKDRDYTAEGLVFNWNQVPVLSLMLARVMLSSCSDLPPSSLTGLCGRSSDDPSALLSELEHRLDPVPGGLPPCFVLIRFSSAAPSLFPQREGCSNRGDPVSVFLMFPVCVCNAVVGPGGADPELPEAASPHHQQ